MFGAGTTNRGKLNMKGKFMSKIKSYLFDLTDEGEKDLDEMFGESRKEAKDGRRK